MTSIYATADAVPPVSPAAAAVHATDDEIKRNPPNWNCK